MVAPRPLRILHLWNTTQRRCGIANAADQVSTALRLAGHHVTDWNTDYSVIHAREEAAEPSAYLPPDAATAFDVIHIGWHPISLNTYGADHFPSGSTAPLLSVYLHDIPPWSGCPFHDRADILWASEPSPGCHVLPYPIADWIKGLPAPTSHFSVGIAGVRGDGHWMVKEVAARHGWEVIQPDPAGWLPFDAAVRHQARATVNVQWYFEGRGKSGGASQALASRRPVLFNDSQMFSHFHGYQDEDGVYFRAAVDDSLERALVDLEHQWHAGTLRMPSRVIRERGWTTWGVPTLVAAWRKGLEAKRG